MEKSSKLYKLFRTILNNLGFVSGPSITNLGFVFMGHVV